MFADVGAEHVLQLSAAVANRDLSVVVWVAHSLNGMAANVGAERVAAIARRLEQGALQGGDDRLDQTRAELEGAFSDVESIMRSAFPLIGSFVPL